MLSEIWKRIVAFFLSVFALFGWAPKNPAPEVTIGNDGYAIIEAGVQFSFESNPTTGYNWEYAIEGDSLRLERDWYETQQTVPAVAGRGGTQYFLFAPVRAGTATLTFTYCRSWESGSTVKVYRAVAAVSADLTVSVQSFEAV